MSCQLKPLSTLAKYMSSVTSIYMSTYNHPVELQFQGIQIPLLASMNTKHKHGALKSLQEEHSYTLNIKISKQTKKPLVVWNEFVDL